MPEADPPAVRVIDAGQVTVNGPPVMVFDRVTFPANPAVEAGRLWTVTESLAELKAAMVRLVVAAVKLNPVTWMIRVADDWLSRVGALVINAA